MLKKLVVEVRSLTHDMKVSNCMIQCWGKLWYEVFQQVGRFIVETNLIIMSMAVKWCLQLVNVREANIAVIENIDTYEVFSSDVIWLSLKNIMAFSLIHFSEAINAWNNSSRSCYGSRSCRRSWNLESESWRFDSSDVWTIWTTDQPRG